MELNPTVVWLVLGLALVFSEFVVPGVILVFFGVGAWVVALTTYLDITASRESQLLSWGVVSILLLVLLRRRVSGNLDGHVSHVQDPNVKLDQFAGKQVVVLEDVIPNQSGGLVELNGSSWKARSDDHLVRGEVAVIADISGITLNVRKEKQDG